MHVASNLLPFQAGLIPCTRGRAAAVSGAHSAKLVYFFGCCGLCVCKIKHAGMYENLINDLNLSIVIQVIKKVQS